MLVGGGDVGGERGDGQRIGAICADGRVHFTPANLVDALPSLRSKRRRRRAFCARSSPTRRASRVHDPLPAAPQFGDEGAANHTRFRRRRGSPASSSSSTDAAGYGGGTAPSALSRAADARGVARRSRAATGSIPRERCSRSSARTAIDAGVFHNDVIAVGEGTFLLCHERAFVDQPAVLAALRAAVGRRVHGRSSSRDDELPLADAVGTYLFNSQLLPRPDGRSAARRAGRMPRASARRRICSTAARRRLRPIAEVLTFDLRQSMRNGGGPACLRLRVPLTGRRAARRLPRNVFLDADARCGARRAGSAATTATGWRQRTCAIRRCSTNRAARSTS